MNYSIRLLACSLTLFITSQGLAQQSFLIKRDSTQKTQTLFQGKLKSWGISASPTFQFGPIGPQAGMSIALHLNNRWEIGTSFSHTINQRNDVLTSSFQPEQKFNAFSIAYTANANKLIHFSFPLLIGVIQSRDELLIPNIYVSPNTPQGTHRTLHNADGWFEGTKSLGIQPGIQAELNVLKHLRLFTAANYRFAIGENSTDAMRGFVGSVGLKIGLFDRGLSVKKK